MRGHEHDLNVDADARSTKPVAPEAESLLTQRSVAAQDASALNPAALLRLQRTAGNAGVGAMLEQSPVLDVVGSGGSPLPDGLRTDMEQRFGEDFGDVRVHTGSAAQESAASVQAHAYTVGNDVVLGATAPLLDSDAGRHTLAHELTHVVQQRSGPVAGTPTGDGISVSSPEDSFEQAAVRNADRVMSQGRSETAPAVQREPDETAMPGPAVQRETSEEELEEGEQA